MRISRHCAPPFILLRNLHTLPLLHHSRGVTSHLNPVMHAPPTPTIESARHILNTRFGHTSFRPGQEQVIKHILATPNSPSSPSIPEHQVGRSLAVFPTGAGKSLCYQLPAVLFRNGLTLVVSPLMALMKDQTDALVRKGFNAALLDSSLTASETRELFATIRQGEVSILFVSPERFKNDRFLGLIQKVGIELFVVDEAHCISEWGDSFRPDYLRLARWADRLQCQRRLALTATASRNVAKDICQRLGIAWEGGMVRLPGRRKELTTRVSQVYEKDEDMQRRIDMLVQRLKERQVGPTIVYVTLQKSAEMVAEQLRKRGFWGACCYHGGMRSEERKIIQDAFMTNMKDGLVVATIAFGMGMDHPGVRYVYHLSLPKSLEGYFQEIGRAGRDGKPAVCETFACVDDVPIVEGFCHAETPRLKSVKGLVHDLLEGKKEGDHIDFSTYNLGFKHDIKATTLGQILAQLDLREGLLEESTPFFSEIVCKMTPERTKVLPGKGTMAGNILAVSDVKRTNIVIDVVKAAETLDLDYGQIARIVDSDLVVAGKVVSASSGKLMLRAVVMKTPTDLDGVAKRMHNILVKAKEKQLKRVAQVADYLSANECQTYFLLRHLGDKIEEGARCGHCEYCLNDGKNPVTIAQVMQEREVKPLNTDNWSLIQADTTLPRDDPLLLARFAAGVSSPIISRKHRRNRLFGSMADHDFKTLLKAAEEECGVKL
eukprot:GFKZ01007033.1.p1 GENE.GFKZ01007033.1~~GFKZ01007033.1.p1  ORF type:complete len:716 (+),score=84.28 GFKZ01007033.1:111-2258(+)